jgi:hypothetical protein
MIAMFTGASRVLPRAVLPALVLATVGMLVAASSSFGQAAVEQYIPDINPTGHHHAGSGSGGGAGSSGSASGSTTTPPGGSAGNAGSGGGNGGTGSAEKKAAAGGAAGLSTFSDPGGGGSSSGGDVPGSGFPLTTFVFIVIGIFLAGLLVYVLLRRRRPRRASL